MAPPMPPPTPWNPQWQGPSGRTDLQRTGGLILAVIFLAVFLTIGVGIFTSASAFGVPAFFLVAVCGIMLIGVVVALLGALGGFQRRALPPPPPIQRPMVPAGFQGPVELACPNCGAAPRAVDRFGVATCDYCGTRFMVR